MGLATPTALLVGTGRGVQQGILKPQNTLWGTPSPTAHASPSARARIHFRNHAGTGVSGEVEDHHVIIGRRRLMGASGVKLPREVSDLVTEAETHGSTAVLVAIDGEFSGLLTVSDTVEETSAEAVAELVRLGMEPLLLTGDNEGAIRRVAAEVGISNVVATCALQLTPFASPGVRSEPSVRISSGRFCTTRQPYRLLRQDF